MKNWIKKYKGIILGVLFVIVCAFFSELYKDAKNNELKDVSIKVSALENEIERLKNKEHDIQYVEKEMTTGLDVSRKDSDDKRMLEWVKPAFTFNNAEEYNANREIFIERLGNDDPFVIDIMPPYIDGYTGNIDEEAGIDDGDKLNMEIVNFKSYVQSINEETKVYSYITFLTCSSSNANGYTGESKAILTYSMDADGNVSNFSVCTPGVK